MIGVLINTGTVLLGSTIGLLIKGGISKRLSDAVMLVLGLCTVGIGIDGLTKGGNIIILIISMVAGTFIGTLVRIDDGINKAACKLTAKFSKKALSKPPSEVFQRALSPPVLSSV